MSQTFMQRKRSRRTMGERYLLLDNFSEEDVALTAHAPDVALPGSAWAICRGSFNTLSGGYARYASGTHGAAIINVGTADCDITARWKCAGASYSYDYGIVFRSNSDATNRFTFNILNLKVAAYKYTALATDTGYGGLPTVVNAAALNLVAGNYYTIRMLNFDQELRIYIDGVMYSYYPRNAAYTANTYVGLATYQGNAAYSWDSIVVRPVDMTSVTAFTILGDSISDGYGEWPAIATSQYRNGLAYIPHNYAAPGSSIQSHMNGQVVSAASDGADYILILLGTNDSSAYDPEAEYQENLIELATSNASAKIYALGILNTTTWTSANRLHFNGHIEAAVNGAVAAGKDVTFWNTDDWINPATDTTDGLHPNAAGHAKIAAQVLARLP